MPRRSCARSRQLLLERACNICCDLGQVTAALAGAPDVGFVLVPGAESAGPAGPGGEGGQQVELPRGEIDWDACTRDRSPVAIDDEIAHSQQLAIPLTPRDRAEREFGRSALLEEFEGGAHQRGAQIPVVVRRTRG